MLLCPCLVIIDYLFRYNTFTSRILLSNLTVITPFLYLSYLFALKLHSASSRLNHRPTKETFLRWWSLRILRRLHWAMRCFLSKSCSYLRIRFSNAFHLISHELLLEITHSSSLIFWQRILCLNIRRCLCNLGLKSTSTYLWTHSYSTTNTWALCFLDRTLVFDAIHLTRLCFVSFIQLLLPVRIYVCIGEWDAFINMTCSQLLILIRINALGLIKLFFRKVIKCH